MADIGNEPAFPRMGSMFFYLPKEQAATLKSAEEEMREADKNNAGLTVREWFAGMALQGFLAMYADPGSSSPSPEHAANESIDYADALLAKLRIDTSADIG